MVDPTFTLVDLETHVSSALDGLHVASAPMVPEVQLHLAADAVIWWAKLEAAAGSRLPVPFWASAWLGGQAVARYVLDNPQITAGYRVLDLASGSGLVGIAAGLTGASTVIANDIDPYASTAIALNARTNGVEVTVVEGDLLDGDGGDAEVILAGDVFYNTDMAEAVALFLHRAVARGARVLVGDPGRPALPRHLLEVVATYQTKSVASFSDAEIEQVHVLRAR